MKWICVIFLVLTPVGGLFSQSVPSSENDRKDEKKAQSDDGSWRDHKLNAKEKKLFGAGFVPGLGDILLGNYGSAAFEISLFAGGVYGAYAYTKSKDFIQPKDRVVKFDAIKYFMAQTLVNEGLAYLPIEGFNETSFDRMNRISSNPVIGYQLDTSRFFLYELNPHLKYGTTYYRMNFTTAAQLTAQEAAMYSLMWSAYSTYASIQGRKQTYAELLASPVSPKALLNWRVWLGFLVSIAAFNNTRWHPTLVPEGQRDSTVAILTVGDGFLGTIPQEAFFRGTLDPVLQEKFGRYGGILASSTFFAAGHYAGQGWSGAARALVFGLYASYLTEVDHGDLRSAVLLHMLVNLMGAYYAARHMHKDYRATVSPRDVQFMQPIYTVNF